MAKQPGTHKIVSIPYQGIAHVRTVLKEKDEDDLRVEIIAEKKAQQAENRAKKQAERERQTKSPPLVQLVETVVEKKIESSWSEYTVVKANGIAWWNVVGPDGKAITEKSMRKKAATELAEKKNGEA